MLNRHSGLTGLLTLSAILAVLPHASASGEFPWLHQSPERIPSPSGNIVYRPIYGLPPARGLIPSVYGGSAERAGNPGPAYTPTWFGGRPPGSSPQSSLVNPRRTRSWWHLRSRTIAGE
jgi:hypothetical protein